jgi:hypothetical protein
LKRKTQIKQRQIYKKKINSDKKLDKRLKKVVKSPKKKQKSKQRQLKKSNKRKLMNKHKNKIKNQIKRRCQSIPFFLNNYLQYLLCIKKKRNQFYNKFKYSHRFKVIKKKKKVLQILLNKIQRINKNITRQNKALIKGKKAIKKGNKSIMLKKYLRLVIKYLIKFKKEKAYLKGVKNRFFSKINKKKRIQILNSTKIKVNLAFNVYYIRKSINLIKIRKNQGNKKNNFYIKRNIGRKNYLNKSDL